jgi:Acyltransferase family
MRVSFETPLAMRADRPLPLSQHAMKYRVDVDGLRAIAVLAVLAYHYRLPVPGGFTGVDVFFVISGYLITSILFREIEDGCFSLSNFYVRRVRRIIPALLARSLCAQSEWRFFSRRLRGHGEERSVRSVWHCELLLLQPHRLLRHGR